MRRPRVAALWLLWSCAANSCSGELHLETCDIRESDCQRNIFLAVQEVRGGLWDPWLELPRMRVIGTEQYRAELELGRRRAEEGEHPYDYLTPALKLLHLIDPQEEPQAPTEFSVGFVAAYYDSYLRSVTIIDRGARTDQREDVRTLAHELVHAAQERDIGFATFDDWISSLDTANAVGSLIEGEAMLYENLVDAKQRGLDPETINWKSYHAGWIASTRERIVDDASPFRLASSGLRYPLGSRYLVSAYLEGAQLGVRRAFAAHPVATSQLMAGRHTEQDRAPDAWSCAYPEPPEQYTNVTADELGGYSLYAFLTRLLPEDEARAWELASAWSGDRFLIYANQDKQLGVLWMLRLRTAEAASSLQQALVDGPLAGSIDAELQGERLHLFVASSALPEYAKWRTCKPTP